MHCSANIGPETQAQYERILGAEEPEQEAAPQPDPAPASELLPLVGRSREWDRLQQAWKRVRAGRVHFALIRGEAGIGKTRLLEEIGHWAALQGVAVAQARQGQPQAGIAQIQTILRDFASRGLYLSRPLDLGRLAQAQWQAGRAEAALGTLAQAQAAVEKRGERYYEAELHRLRGKWLWQREELAAATAQLQKALAVARQQQARLFELRTLVTLFHLWQAAGDPEQAGATCDALQSTYDWFTEGHDLPELRAARTVLATGAA